MNNSKLDDYEQRIKMLVEFQSKEECEILSDITEENARVIQVFSCLTSLQSVIIIPTKVDNVANIAFFGINAGKTLAAIKEGFSDEEISHKIQNMIPLLDETSCVNFLCGETFCLKK